MSLDESDDIGDFLMFKGVVRCSKCDGKLIISKVMTFRRWIYLIVDPCECQRDFIVVPEPPHLPKWMKRRLNKEELQEIFESIEIKPGFYVSKKNIFEIHKALKRIGTKDATTD